MSTPKVYGLILGLSIAAAAVVETASSAARPVVVASEETWTIPGVGRTQGQNNTFFVSDLALTNVGGAAANVTIAFVGPGGLPAKPITIAAGATTAYRDIVNALWSASGIVGALSVESRPAARPARADVQHRGDRHLRRRATGFRVEGPPGGGRDRRQHLGAAEPRCGLRISNERRVSSSRTRGVARRL